MSDVILAVSARTRTVVMQVASTVFVAFIWLVATTSVARATIFAAEGGKGARGEIVRCPDGYLLTGFHGSAGSWIDSIGLLCSEVRPPDYRSGDARKLSPRGGPGGSIVEQSCGTDGAIRTIRFSIFEEGNLAGITPKVIWKISFECSMPRNGSDAGEGTFMGVSEIPGTGRDRIRDVVHQCTGSEYATGLSIRYGVHVNAVGLVCGAVQGRGGIAGAVAAANAVGGERLEPGMENNTGRPGADFDRFHINDQRPDRCQSECLLRSDRCKAWTYVRPGLQHKYAVCYLKNAVPPAVPNTCCISGVLSGKLRDAFDRPVGVAPRQQPPAVSPATSPNASDNEPQGKIGEKYARLGGANSGIGPALGGETDAPHGGRCQRFQHGSICWHPQIGEAFTVWGDIHKKWMQFGGVEYGYPITDELTTPDGRGRFNHFRAMQHPNRPEASIYWTPQTGAQAVYGLIRDAWARQGWERGPLGYPTSDEYQDGKFRRSNFERGHILWAPDTGIQIVNSR